MTPRELRPYAECSLAEQLDRLSHSVQRAVARSDADSLANTVELLRQAATDCARLAKCAELDRLAREERLCREEEDCT